MSRRINILSIDGGGIRGIIPAVILNKLQEKVGEIRSAFDLIAGTSTGGIIALGLGTPVEAGKPLTPLQLLALYKENAARIFDGGWFPAIKNLFGPKYSPAGIERVLQDRFGGVLLHSAFVPLLISSYDLQSQLPFFFKSSRANADPKFDWPVWRVARATSAAPTFFPPLHLVGEGGDYALVDGGVFVNNPAMAAYAEARRLFPDASEFVIVSVGTGDRNDKITYAQSKDWGLLGWARQIVPVMMDSVSEAVDYGLDAIVGTMAGCKHYRLQPTLTIASPDMDNITSSNLADLEEEAQLFLDANVPLIEEVCSNVIHRTGAHP